MNETFEYSKKKIADSEARSKHKAKMELLISLCVVGILVAGYVAQHVLHWW